MDENINLNGNLEIGKALKEFEAKQNAEQVQKTPEASKNSETSKMAQLLMKWSGGAIKEQKQAEYILLGFVILAILVSGFLVFGESIKQNKSPMLYQEDITPTARATIPADILKTIPYRNAK